MQVIPLSFKCQHPFGPGLHVIVPEDEIVSDIILKSHGVFEEYMKDAEALAKFVEGEHKSAMRARIYPCIDPYETEDIFVIICMIQKFQGPFGYQCCLIRIEPEYPLPGLKIVEQMRNEMFKLFKEKVKREKI